MARALANECSKGARKVRDTVDRRGGDDVQVAFFMRKGADCLSKWVGESERQLRCVEREKE